LDILAGLGITASRNTAGGITVDATNQSTGLNFSQQSSNGLGLTDNVDVATLGSESDFVQALGGDDVVNTGAGGDVVEAGQGDDRVDLGAGSDTGSGGQGNDQVEGGEGNDVLSGDLGSDQVVGGTGNDLAKGNQDSDTVDGGAGNDVVHGGQGNDSVLGGDGDDTVFGDAGDDTLTGGSGRDVFRFEYFVQQGSLRTAEEVGANPLGVDTITDFNPAEDKIQLDKRIFASLGDTIQAGDVEVVTNFDPAAQGTNTAKIIYDPTSGLVYYNPTAEQGDEMKLVQLDPNLDITADDFEVF
jgi:Ca2+-binding RTX toxin-like protein